MDIGKRGIFPQIQDQAFPRLQRPAGFHVQRGQQKAFPIRDDRIHTIDTVEAETN